MKRKNPLLRGSRPGLLVRNLQDIKLGDYIHGKEMLEKQLKEIDSNIEEIGRLCDRKKQRSYEEYNNVLNSNKALIEEDLSKVRFRLVEAYKKSTKEDVLRNLQKEFTNKKNEVFDTDKEIQSKNRILGEYENKINQLKEENKFLNQEIKNSNEYSFYLHARITELEEPNIVKVNTIAVNNSIFNQNANNCSVDNKEISNCDNNNTKDIQKLEKYFSITEETLNQKLMFEERLQKEKYAKYKNLSNFKNPIQEILKVKMKEHQVNQVNQLTEKVSNQEIFFNSNDIDASKSKHVRLLSFIIITFIIISHF